jgi:RNA-directed DNA polymerase
VWATRWSRSLTVLPREICWAPRGAVAPRTKERRSMAQQKSERRIVPQGRRKVVPTDARETHRGGKAAPVEQQSWQLGLTFGTAESPGAAKPGAVAGAEAPRGVSAPRGAPKPKVREKPSTAATMEEVTGRLRAAFEKVASNAGAPGPDRETIFEVRAHLDETLAKLEAALLAGSYTPGDIRRVWIPKASGGERGLGIPNVIDRVVQEAVRAVLEPQYEPTFHASSHGFRPGRSCHTAIAEAKQHLEEGYEWVVDLDLEKFFDRVNHQRLMARLAQRVSDRRVLVVIGRMLQAAVVMPDGVRVSTEGGVPQGGPLSPLLSNVVLDELDRELAERGHRFVRYADDCNIYVGSERAGQRVMASVVRFIEKRLRLKVNVTKSAVARPEERHFVGFRLRREPLDGEVEVLLSKRSKERIDTRIRELTPRNWGGSLDACILLLNGYLVGWLGFFGICSPGIERTLGGLDAHIRRRLRALKLADWKRKLVMVRKLIQLKVRSKTAWRCIYGGRRSVWALSHTPAVDRGLRNAYFAERGLVSLQERWRARYEDIVAPKQLSLALG